MYRLLGLDVHEPLVVAHVKVKLLFSLRHLVEIRNYKLAGGSDVADLSVPCACPGRFLQSCCFKGYSRYSGCFL